MYHIGSRDWGRFANQYIEILPQICPSLGNSLV